MRRLESLRQIYQKEMRMLLRDRQVILATVLVPAVLYPSLILGVFEVASLVQAIGERRVARVLVRGDASEELSSAIGTRAGLLSEDGNGIELVALDSSRTLDGDAFRAVAPEELLRSEGDRAPAADAIVEVVRAGPGPLAGFPAVAITVHYSSALDASRTARKRLEEALGGWQEERLTRIAREVGVEDPQSFLDPVEVRYESVSTGEEIASHVAGLILPLLLTIVIAVGVFYPALETTVGEKERGTLETTLISPAARSTIVLGKYLAVTTAGVLSFALNFSGMVFTLLHLESQLPVGDLRISPGTVVLALAGALVLAAFLGAIMMLVAFFARSYKEGQSWLSPVYFATLVPAVVLADPEARLSPLSAVTPLLNCALLFREALADTVVPGYALLVLASSALWAALALFLAARLLRREDVTLGATISLGTLLRALRGSDRLHEARR